jgi:hypothetical protein
MNIPEFIAKWRQVELTERSASQQHFLDLCEVFDHPKPALDDPTGERFTFERGASKHGGGKGWADVWKRGFFGWEYKGKHKDLAAAYDQLLKYREALENPPLLVVCDMDRFEIHTNFTATVSKTHLISLDDLDTPRNIEIMRNVFHDANKLRPDATSAAITQNVAQRLAEVAQGLRKRGLDAMDVARFLDRIVFCLFAEDVGLLPRQLFSKIVDKARNPEHFAKLIAQLFDAMNDGGDFGIETIRHFNGNLFVKGPVLGLTSLEIKHVKDAARLDWSAVDPSIFGTLFQRGLDPNTRAQLGAQYTSREDIETLIEPVVMHPLRREWEDLKKSVEEFVERYERTSAVKSRLWTSNQRRRAYLDATRQPRNHLRQFHEKLCGLKILDPACGSGNFLYVTLQKLKDLEKEVLIYAAEKVFETLIPHVGPWQFYGIEINPYAFELAQTTLWIGYLQWIQSNGFGVPAEPILREMDNFKNIDAILDLSDPENPKEPDWPNADFIVGNPPFLGGSRIWSELGKDYQEKLWSVYKDRVPGSADLVCYWFEKARQGISDGKWQRVGLLATQAIRGGANREVLNRVKESGEIFFAIADQDWILDGASVHISMVGFDAGLEQERTLNGNTVISINSDLSSRVDITKAKRLTNTFDVCFIGTKKAGTFNIPESLALEWLNLPNPHGRPNSDVLRPWVNGQSIAQRPSPFWIIDVGTDMQLREFSLYERPFAYVEKTVKPQRESNKREMYRKKWWLHAETRPGMRKAVQNLARYLVTTGVSKFRLFVWVENCVLSDGAVFVFARSDDYFFGVLNSRIHEVWSLVQGTQVRERESGFRYTPTTCFETFPFPEPTSEQCSMIGDAARELNELRAAWLNPPEWTHQESLEFPASLDGPWSQYVIDPNEHGIGTALYKRVIARNEDAKQQLASRTLTNLYNERPSWLDLAHRRLDEAVFAAYGWEHGISDEEILTRLLEINLKA